MYKRLVLGVLLSIGFTLGLGQNAFAEGYSYEVRTRVTISENFSTTVETNVKATRDGGTIPTTISIPLYGQDPEGLRAVDDKGTKLNVSADGDSLVVRLNSIQARGDSKWSVKTTYAAKTGLSLGASSLFMMAPYDYGDMTIASEEVTVLHGAELGTFVTRGTKPVENSTTGGSFVTKWRNNNGALDTGYGLLFGDNTVADVSFARTLENNSFWWQTMTVVLPPDTNQQQVYIKEITPEPTNVRLDIDGNVIVEYRLRPRQSLDVAGLLRVSLNSYTYSLDSELLANDIDPLLRERYTELNDVWADTVLSYDAGAETPVAELVENIYDDVSKEFALVDSESNYDQALFRANKLIGELRANGIPSRLVIGAVFGDGATVFQQPRAHAWVEVNIPGIGWVSIDPSFEQNGDYFGVADVQRVALALRGYDPDFPPENSEFFRIEFTDIELPNDPVMKPEISATKYMILPGLALRSVQAQMPEGVIVDNTGVQVGDEQAVALGSLAPFQNVTIRSLDFLGAAFSSQLVKYGTLLGEDLSDDMIVSQATTEVSYVPISILLSLAIIGFLFTKFILPKIGSGRARKAKKEKVNRLALKIASDKAGGEIENVDMLAALDIPEEDSIEEEVPPVIHRSEESEQLESNVPPTPVPGEKTASRSRPRPAPRRMTIEQAKAASPGEIRREIARRQSRKHIIQ